MADVEENMLPFSPNQFFFVLTCTTVSAALGYLSRPTSFDECMMPLFYIIACCGSFWLGRHRDKIATLLSSMGATSYACGMIVSCLNFFLGIELSLMASVLASLSFGCILFWAVSESTHSNVDFQAMVIISPLIAISFLGFSSYLGVQSVSIKFPVFWSILWCLYLHQYVQHLMQKYRDGIPENMEMEEYIISALIIDVYLPLHVMNVIKEILA